MTKKEPTLEEMLRDFAEECFIANAIAEKQVEPAMKKIKEIALKAVGDDKVSTITTVCPICKRSVKTSTRISLDDVRKRIKEEFK